MPYLRFSAVFLLSTGALLGQNLTCNISTGPTIVRMEGITERTGDMVFACAGGAPGQPVTGNLTLFLTVNITNRVASNSNAVQGVIFTVDNGSGPQPVAAHGLLTGPSTLTFNGASFSLSPTGSVTLRMTGIRAAANLAGSASQISALLSFSSTPQILFTTSQVPVGTAERGLYAGFSSKIMCSQSGSPLPANPASFASFIAAGSVFNTTRLTEGFADAFSPRSDFQGLNADTGTRFLITYSGFPAGARLFVPNVVAGSDAVKPTAAGDFGPAASGGQYTPGGNGSLLLSLIQPTDSLGRGGMPVYTPGAPASGTVSFDGMSEVTLTNGAGYAVYEVVDANPFLQESAQFPTFLALPANTGANVQTAENVSLAPVSSVVTATSTDPIPRFQALSVPDDCTLVGDCGASYFPKLNVQASSVNFSVQAGTGLRSQFIQIQNTSGGVMQWTTSVAYQSGSGWLSIRPARGTNTQTIELVFSTANLTPGAYQATLTIDAGPIAGAQQIPVTFTVTQGSPSVPTPTIASVQNAATLAAGPLAPGSLATIMGTQFSSTNLSVTFDSTPAEILFSNSTQINLLVPASLGSKISSQVVVQANGVSSAPQTVALAPFAPGIFTNGILNQDYSVNSASHPAVPGSVIQIFATGLSGQGVITARIGGQTVNQPYYGGAAPGLTGVQQIDLILPQDLQGSSVAVSVCGGPTSDQVVCSPTVPVALSQF